MASKAAAHTDEVVIKRCQGQDFLALCIVKSGFDNELCSDVTDACGVSEVNALDLAGMGEEEAAQRLFLTNDEAKKLLKVCSRMCAREGVNFGDGIADAESSEEEQAETVLTASSPPRASSPTPEAIGELSDRSGAAEADGPDQLRAVAEGGSEVGASGADSSLTREQREEQERKQQQLKEEQLAAARAAFAPKAIPASAATTAAFAIQPMQGGFPPGFSPPPPFGSSSSNSKSHASSHKPSTAIPHSRKLSAYDGSSFGVRENPYSPSPIQSSRTAGRHAAAAPSPRTPPANSFSASVRQMTTPRMTSSVAASRYQYERIPSGKSKDSATPSTTKHHLSADAMKPADMTTPTPPPKPMLTPEAMKPADMTLQSPLSPPSSSARDAKNLTPGSKTKLEGPAASPMPRMPSYLRPTAAYQAQVAKRSKEADMNMKGKIPTGSLGGRTPPTPPIRPSSASTQLPAHYVHKAMHDPYSPYLSGLSAKAKRDATARTQVHRRGAGGTEQSQRSVGMSDSLDKSSHHPVRSPSPNVTPSAPEPTTEFAYIRPSLLKPTKAFLAATNGNSQRKARPSSQVSTSSTSSSSRVSHTQSAILTPADVAQPSRTFKARPLPKFMRPASGTGPTPSTTSPTEDTATPFRAMASTPNTPRLSASAERRHPTHHHTGLQHTRGSHSDPEEDDLDEWFSVRTPSGKHYITPSMLQPHPHIPMRQLASESGVYKKPAWQSSSRVPRGPADEQLRMSAHKGSLIPNISGQVSASQVHRSMQLKQQQEQQQALLRALSAANHHNAMEKAEAMHRSSRSGRSGASSARTSQQHDAAGHSEEQRSEGSNRHDLERGEGGEEECRVGTPPTPDPGTASPAPHCREYQTVHSNGGRGEEGQ